MTTPGFFDDFLEDNPDILFEARRPQIAQAGLGESFLNYWRGRQGDVWRRYLGSIGTSALSGQEPTTTFQSFLSDFSFQDQFRRLSPQGRGQSTSVLAPRIRYNL
jgi:hypothetical protein